MLCYFCRVISSAKHSLIRFVALALCVIFLAQISLDIAIKMNQSEKKVALAEKEIEDTDDDSPVKEKEIDAEEDAKAIHDIQYLILLVQNNLQTLHKQHQNINLPQGFYNTFTPPPDHKIILS